MTKNSRRILITGHQGYIGGVLVPLLMDAGYDVTGVDNGLFEECQIMPSASLTAELRKDIRDVTVQDLEGFYAVIHLAALSNDPIGNLNIDWTADINFKASVRLARMAREAGVERFLFSSSCIMYGASEAAVVNEDSPLDPKTEYARSKVQCEDEISRLAGYNFSPTFLRNGTVYGLSPRMRFDTVVNNLVGSAMTTGRVTLYSDGEPWRPVVHVRDVARAFLAVLEAPGAKVHNQAFNVGANHLNHQVREIAQTVVAKIPGAQLDILSQPDADQRTYRSDFSKFACTFPTFSFNWTLEMGVENVYQDLRALGLDHSLFVDKRFTRLKWLRHLLDKRRLDSELRWKAQAAQTAEAGVMG